VESVTRTLLEVFRAAVGFSGGATRAERVRAMAELTCIVGQLGRSSRAPENPTKARKTSSSVRERRRAPRSPLQALRVCTLQAARAMTPASSEASGVGV